MANTTEKNPQSTADEPASLAQVLYRELLALRPAWLNGVSAPAGQSASETERSQSSRALYVRAGHAACAKAESDSAACTHGSTAVALRSSRRFIGGFLPGDSWFVGCQM